MARTSIGLKSDERFAIRIPASLKRALADVATRKGRSASDLTRDAILHLVAEH